MDKDEVLKGLVSFRARLDTDVMQAFADRGKMYGRERFQTWRRKFSEFLDENLPGQSKVLAAKLKHLIYVGIRGESDVEEFWRVDGEATVAFIDSLIIDVQNDEIQIPIVAQQSEEVDAMPTRTAEFDTREVLIVHGHDEAAKERTARFVEKLGFTAIILAEQPDEGRTVIEKIEDYSNVGFAIVLYTPDDLGNSRAEAEKGSLKPRARQNVVLEHGYLMGRIGRERVAWLVEGDHDLELPSDIHGVVWVSDTEWRIKIAREMRAAGYPVDSNKIS